METTKIKRSLTDEQVLAQAKSRFAESAEAESEVRREMLDDLEFRNLKQWPDEIKRQRQMEGRPCLVMDRTNQFVNQVANDSRQAQPSPKVSPVDDNADVKTAEVFQGIYRRIERQSNASRVRAWASDHQATIGRGWYKIATEYAGPDTWDQEIYIRRIKHQLRVYADPSAEEPDLSDGRYAFEVVDITADRFKQEFPNSKLASFSSFESIGDAGAGDWITREGARVALYHWVEMVPRELLQLVDGTSGYRDELPKDLRKEAIVRSRKVYERRVWCDTINGIEVLETYLWPGQWIPLIPVIGEEIVVNGKTNYRGLVRIQKDAQRQFNFMRSAQVEAIALAPRAPWLVAAGQTEEFPEWETANVKNHSKLRYRPTDVAGQPVPMPTRNTAEPAIQAITMAVGQAAEDMKAAVGIYDASLGARSNERSGKAILARQREGDTATYHYTDNLASAIQFEAKQILDLIPKVYDRPGRVLRIIGEADEEHSVMVGPVEDAQQLMPAGVKGIYDLSAGKYDIAVDIGKSYSTKRQEAAEAMIQLSSTVPIIGQAAPDLIAKNLDLPGADQLAKRLKRALPANLTQDEDQSQGDPAQMAQMIEHMGQMVEQLAAQKQGLEEVIATRQPELEMKERLAMADLEFQREKLVADTQVKMAQLGSQEAMNDLRLQIQTVLAEVNDMREREAMQREHERAEREMEMQQKQMGQQQAPEQPEAPEMPEVTGQAAAEPQTSTEE